MMDMTQSGAYFEDTKEYCQAKVNQIEIEIVTLKAKKEIYQELYWKMETAIDKEKKKALGEIEY